MSEKAQHRFSRTELLIGSEGLAKLSNARVAVVGLGGVGAYTVEALARAGVGWLILVDFDDICLTNTNRQIHAIEGNYGRSKVEVMAERVKSINPEAIVVSWKEFMDAKNMDVILHGRVSYVVDAIDTVYSKVDLISYCKENGIPVISSMGTGNKFDPLAFRVDDISKTHTCPLAKSVRKALREKGIKVLSYFELSGAEREKLREYFERNIFPLLTPLGFDSGHPFPHISNLSLNLAVLIDDPDYGERFARVKIPPIFTRLIVVPEDGQERISSNFEELSAGRFVWLEQLIAANLDLLFPGQRILGAYPFRITRDADLGFDESEETHGFRRIRSLSRAEITFSFVQKVTQPVEAVDHNNRHAFIGILNTSRHKHFLIIPLYKILRRLFTNISR
jgi:tRNA A37 threonylcarbamoyladenosine dehydratase